MAQRKLQQEIDKCFKNVDLGVESFDSLYDKYEQSGNAPQREKAVEALKTQCKKLQRLRDQIKQWAASNEVKDKVSRLSHLLNHTDARWPEPFAGQA